MEIKTKKIGKHTLVALNGRLDIGHSDEVEAKLLDDVQSGQGDILINLENISYISSSGIRIFVGMVRELEKRRKLKLCCITPPVKKVFDVVELLDLFEVYETESSALDSLA